MMDDNDDSCDDDIFQIEREKIREELIQKLVSEWNQINNQIERRSWRDRDERMDAEDFHAEQINELRESAYQHAISKGASKEEAEMARQKAEDDYNQARDLEERKPYLRMEVIEQLLGDCGARMARPYEHWNEDEKYMEYMENRYSYEDDYYNGGW
jgi:hypothetical protein